MGCGQERAVFDRLPRLVAHQDLLELDSRQANLQAGRVTALQLEVLFMNPCVQELHTDAHGLTRESTQFERSPFAGSSAQVILVRAITPLHGQSHGFHAVVPDQAPRDLGARPQDDLLVDRRVPRRVPPDHGVPRFVDHDQCRASGERCELDPSGQVGESE